MKNNIKHEKGKVTYVMRTGENFVKSTMPLAYAKSLVKRGKDVEEKDARGYGVEICVDDTYFFPVEPAPRKKDSDEVTE